MRGLVIWNTYAQPLVIKRLGIVDLCLADSNNNIFGFVRPTVPQVLQGFSLSPAWCFCVCAIQITLLFEYDMVFSCLVFTNNSIFTCMQLRYYFSHTKYAMIYLSLNYLNTFLSFSASSCNF